MRSFTNRTNLIPLIAALSFFALWYAAYVFLTFERTANAGTGDNISGFAWEGNWIDDNGNGVVDVGEVGGIGWISFNCTNTGSCLTSDYGVRVDESQRFSGGTGSLSGYAWAGNEDTTAAPPTTTFEWLSFNASDVSSCPGGQPPQINWSTGQVSGWARFLSGGTAAAGGWDGCVSLRGTATNGSSYGVSINLSTGSLAGYAWGGGDVVGWIRFDSGASGVRFDSTLPAAGACGPAAGVPSATAPSSGLCSAGVGTTPTNIGTPPTTPNQWGWTCNGASTPASCTAPFPQCSDGIDNDGDGGIDFGGANPDPGCNSTSDNVERNFQFREF